MKKENSIPGTVKYANILIYDDENIKYFNGVATSFGIESLDDIERYMDGTTHRIHRGYILNASINNMECLDNIKLDDTMMKRIAKFNKNQECLRLDKQIEEKKKELKELEDLLQDREERWNKVKEYISNIYDLDLDDEYDDYYD